MRYVSPLTTASAAELQIGPRNGGAAVGLGCDVRSESDLDTAVEAAASEFGRLDVMFANARTRRQHLPPSYATGTPKSVASQENRRVIT